MLKGERQFYKGRMMISHLSLSKWWHWDWPLCPFPAIVLLLITSSSLVHGGRRDSRHSSNLNTFSNPSSSWNKSPPSFSFASISGSNVNLFRAQNKFTPFHDDTMPIIAVERYENASQSQRSNYCALEKEWLLEELGVWDPPWGPHRLGHGHRPTKTKAQTPRFQRDQSPNSNYNPYSFVKDVGVGVGVGNDDVEGDNEGGRELDDQDPLSKLESTLSRVKLIPDEHHVSGFLHKGVVKRFLFINDKFGNPLSITITPCTSILHWVVKLWPVLESNTTSPILGSPPQLLKTFRTQRPTTFSVPSASRGVYSVDIRPINWDSYVHLYASSSASGTSRLFFGSTNDQVMTSTSTSSEFIQHMFTHVELEVLQKPKKQTGLNFPPFEDGVNTNLNQGQGSPIPSTSSNRPRIWAQRLRGNRLHVRWDTSPQNPHLMQYCIVVNTRRDYTSLCSASGERYGVLPPDLMHVTYYGDQNQGQKEQHQFMVQSDEPLPHNRHRHRRKGRHGHTSKRKPRTPKDDSQDIVIGCTNKKTNYILNNLIEGRLYYFNVFVRDTSTNVSLPYVRTTLKYHTPQNAANSLRDNKPAKIKLFASENADGTTTTSTIIKPLNVTTVKFNLNKPCSELSLYVMPCGGGSVSFQLLHGLNRTVYTSTPTDSLDIIKLAMPQKGKYYLKISPYQTSGEHRNKDNWAKMVEVYVAKKNRRLPLPRLPAITKLTEDDSQRTCDSVSLQWWPSPDPRDNEYCIFLKQENHPRRHYTFKKPNQCDVDRSLRSDPYVTHSLCLQRTLTPETMLLSQRIIGLHPDKTYIVQLILKRHNGKSLSYDLTVVKTLKMCSE